MMYNIGYCTRMFYQDEINNNTILQETLNCNCQFRSTKIGIATNNVECYLRFIIIDKNRPMYKKGFDFIKQVFTS